MPEQDRHLLKLCFLLCMFAGFLLHSLGASEIPLDSKLSIVDKNMWVSPNGDFAFGFFNSPDQPNYSVGIRSSSKSIPLDKQIVVWIAGADLILGNNSYVQLTQDGELILFDSLKGVIWSSKTRQLSVVSAALNDNGNLVLLNKEKHIVWQSFDTPSDTLLPGQKFSMFQTLRAASKNSVSSYYTLFMVASGKLQLRWESHVIYWTSGNPSSISNLSAFLTSDGALQLRDQNLKPVWSLFGEDHNDSVSYRFLRLDVDGNLRLYSWVEPSKSWRSVWQAVKNQCNVFATCGQHGICVFTESGSPDCECPFKHTNESISRCLIPNHPCESGSDMLKYMHTFLYGIYPPTDDLVVKVSLQECKSLCLNDPSCTAVTFSNDGTARCLMKRTQYVTGYSDPSLSSVSFVKMCAYPLAVNPNHVTTSPSPVEQSHKFCFPCVIGVASGMFVVFVLVQLALGFWFIRRRNLDRKKAAFAYTCPNSNGLIVLSFSEIEELTENFKHQIGPKMFKGVLPSKKPVAIKDLNATIEERKYRSAVSKMGSIHHKNLVKLQGYCCESDHRFVVYEYAKNGSVEKYIEDPKLCKKLTWGKRFDICLSVARAICYLHTSCREFMSHGNLKCENVVLEENLEAKVTEFGLGKVVSEASCSSAERDVEDFGKMVLVLVSGCRGVGDLCVWAYKEWMEGRPENVVDRRISGGFILQELERVLRIAFWCLQFDERQRPSMREVVKVLEGTLSVDPPPPPFGCHGPLEEEEEP